MAGVGASARADMARAPIARADTGARPCHAAPVPCDTIAATTDGDSRHPAPAAPTRLEVAIRLVLALGVAYQRGFVRRGLAGEALRTIVGVGPRSRPSTSSRT